MICKQMGKLEISLISNFLAMFISLGISFLLTPFLISHLGKETYSFFPLANNFISYMNIISLALNSMASRFITISLVSGEIEKSRRYFSTVFYSNIILAIILILPMGIIIIFLNSFLQIPDGLLASVRVLFTLMFLALIIQLIFTVYGVATFAKERMDLYAIQNIGQNVLRVILYILLFSVFQTSIVIMGIVTLILAIYNGAIQYYWHNKLMPEYKVKKKYFSSKYLKELIGSGIWNSINNIGTSLLQTMMLLMANKLISVNAAGDLSIVQILSNLMTTIISTVYGVLLPRVANVYAAGNKNKTIDTVKFSQKILSAISVVPLIIIILFGRQFFDLWVPSENGKYLQLLSIVTILPLLIHGSMWMVYGLNLMNNRIKKPAITFLLVGILNVILTIVAESLTNLGVIIIPAISSALNIAYYLFYIPRYSAREMGVTAKTFYPHIIKTLLFSLGFCTVGYPISTKININSWPLFFVYVFIFACICELFYILTVFDKMEKFVLIYKIKKIIYRLR